jgi:hypothetical protein
MLAKYDLNEEIVQVQCRYDVFDGLSDAFRGNLRVWLEVSREDESLVFKSTKDGEGVLSSTLSIKKSDRCDTQIARGVDNVRVSLALGDFIVAVKIVKILNQRMSIYILGPGLPVVVKAGIPNQVSFEMPLATAVDEEIEQETDQQDVLTTEPSGLDRGTDESDASQVSPWRRQRSVKTESEGGIPVAGSPQSQHSKEYAILEKLGPESPLFPLRRRETGQYADPSQPGSDATDTDD